MDPGDDAPDVVLGDSGRAVFTQGVLTLIDTIAPEYGGDDAITTGNGPDVVIGGTGNDLILAGEDDAEDVVLGDNGRATFQGTAEFDPGEEEAILSFNFAANLPDADVSGTAGAAPAGLWHNLIGGGPNLYGDTFEEPVLFDDGLRATDVSIYWGRNIDTRPIPATLDRHDQILPGLNQDQRLFEGYLSGSLYHILGVDIDGLGGHFKSYDVLVYLDADNGTSRSHHSIRRVTATINLPDGTITYEQTFFVNDPDDQTFEGTYVRAAATTVDEALVSGFGNYVCFEIPEEVGLASSDGRLSIRVDNVEIDGRFLGLNRPAISAVQIVGQRLDMDRVETTDPAYAGHDYIVVSGGPDLVMGGSGDDIIDAAGTLDAYEDADVVVGDEGRATLVNGAVTFVHTLDGPMSYPLADEDKPLVHVWRVGT